MQNTSNKTKVGKFQLGSLHNEVRMMNDEFVEGKTPDSL